MKSTTLANDVLDQLYNGGASGSVVIGSTTYTLPFKVIYTNTVCTAGAVGTEWTTGGGYTHSGTGTAGGVTLSGNFSSAAASASKANTTAVTVTNAPAGTWADNAIYDSSSTNKYMNAKGTPSLAKTVNSGDTCTIAIGALVGTEA